MHAAPANVFIPTISFNKKKENAVPHKGSVLNITVVSAADKRFIARFSPNVLSAVVNKPKKYINITWYEKTGRLKQNKNLKQIRCIHTSPCNSGDDRKIGQVYYLTRTYFCNSINSTIGPSRVDDVDANPKRRHQSN